MKQLTHQAALIDCAEFYLEDCMALGESDATLTTKRALVRKFVEWAGSQGINQLSQINMQVLEGYRRHINAYRKRNGKPLDISTQGARLMAVTKFVKVMDYYEAIDGAFARKFRLPRMPKRLPRDLPSASDIERVLEQSMIMGRLGLRNRAIVEVFYATGIRRKELVELDIRALNFEQNAITIRDGKNSRDRVVPIAPRAQEWVTLYLQELRPKLANLQSDDALFLTEAGNRIRPHKVTDMLTKCVQRSGIDKKGACHILRHAAATEMSRNGLNIRLLQEMLGHSSITSTEGSSPL